VVAPRISVSQIQPPCFQLQVTEIGVFDCELVRVNGTDYGVRFVVTS